MIKHEYALPSGYQLQNYRIEGLLGHGGFGLTYLAYDSRLQRQVAIKELLPVDFAVRQANGTTVVCRSERDRESMDWARQRFLDEGRMIAFLHHPHILAVYDVFEQNGTGYLVTSYIRGGDFLQWMKQRNHPLTEAELRAFTLGVLGALEKIHAQGALHRDLKPQNILMEPDGIHPVLIDFGNARMSTGEKTKSITAIVTPGFAPFEQYTTRSKQGAWTDVYSLGAVLYRAITGQAPPDSADRVDEDPMTPAGEFTTNGYSATFLATVDKALQRRPSKRWQTVAEWRNALQGHPTVNALGSRTASSMGSPPPVPEAEPESNSDEVSPPSPLPARLPKRKRNPTRIGLGIASIAAAAILTTVAAYFYSPPLRDTSTQLKNTPPSPQAVSLDNGSIGQIYDLQLPGKVTIKFCYCPPGPFTMGSPDSEKERADDEEQAEVTITKGYWMAQTECTQAQWQALAGKNPSHFTGSLQLPVETVSYRDMMDWVTKANRACKIPTGWKLTVPSEAQWEYACRAGTKTPFSFGSILSGKEANCAGNNPYGTSMKGQSLGKTSPVGSYAMNAWSLYDMHGNVWEWCADWYGQGGGEVTNTSGSMTNSFRVCRGGSWDSVAHFCRTAFRGKNLPSLRYDNLGFRPALIPAGR